jgi:hypothetical protein
MSYGANSDSRIAIAIQTLEDERMESSQMPLLVLSEEVIFLLF